MKIIFSDFDGTLYKSSEPGGFARNLECIEKWRGAGNKFALATGRSIASLARTFADYPRYFDYILTNNGSVVFDANSALLHSEELPEGLIDDLAKTIAEDYPSVSELVYFAEDNEYREKPTRVVKLRIWLKRLDLAGALASDLVQRFGNLIQAHPVRSGKASGLSWVGAEYVAFVDVVSVNAGKENAIRFILEREKIEGDSACTVGDDVNDINMLKDFDGYAIDGSPAEVVDAAGGRTVADVSDLIEIKMSPLLG